MTRPLVIGVMGGGGERVPSHSPAYAMARAVGGAIGRAGAILLCGGGAGVMEAGARGAREAGGLSIGILPGLTDRPNPYIDCAIATDLGDARNVVNVTASDGVIVLHGGAGTLSEIGLALKAGGRAGVIKPVVALASWRSLENEGLGLLYEDEPHRAVERVFAELGVPFGGRTTRPAYYPPLPGQEEGAARFAAFVGSR